MTSDDLAAAALEACSKQSEEWLRSGHLDIFYDHDGRTLRDVTRAELLAILDARDDRYSALRAAAEMARRPHARWMIGTCGNLFVWRPLEVRLVGSEIN